MTYDQSLGAMPTWVRVLRNPLSRIVLYAAMLAGFFWLTISLLPKGPGKLSDLLGLGPFSTALWLYALKSLVPIVVPYWLLVRLVEGRRIDELAPRKLLPGVVGGWLVGTAILVLAAAAMALFGAYSVKGVNAGVNWFAPLIVLGVLAGITEEIVCRGVLFRIVEDGLGTWIALILSSLFFGIAHIANPGATAWSSIAIALEAGLLLGMAYAWTRSLWFVMALHAAWNFAQGPLLGIHVSGITVRGFIEASTQGSVWLSGGEFGAEGSVTTVVICVAVAAFFTYMAITRKQIRPPFWRRQKLPATGGSEYVAADTGITAQDPSN